MGTIDEFTQLKQKVEKLHDKKIRAEGALEQLTQRVKDEMKVESIEDGRAVLKKLERETEKSKKRFDGVMAVFVKEWGEKLDVQN